jgi:hypothetical protein
MTEQSPKSRASTRPRRAPPRTPGRTRGTSEARRPSSRTRIGPGGGRASGGQLAVEHYSCLRQPRFLCAFAVRAAGVERARAPARRPRAHVRTYGKPSSLSRARAGRLTAKALAVSRIIPLARARSMIRAVSARPIPRPASRPRPRWRAPRRGRVRARRHIGPHPRSLRRSSRWPQLHHGCAESAEHTEAERRDSGSTGPDETSLRREAGKPLPFPSPRFGDSHFA